MSDDAELTPQEQLAVFAGAQGKVATESKRGARQLGITCILLGLVLGTLHGLLHVFTPDRGLGAFFVLCAVAVLVIVVLSLGYQKLHRFLPLGFSKRYLWSLFLSIGIYGLALTLITTPMPWFVVALLGLAVALPLLLGGLWMVKK